ncbi:hypothetical protein HJC23_004166 [Cyclotella cryptica]|eukprot:CCRYP_018991-RA/>CCRYP_018991-RA protein AED:0.17 eAED:0.17 QI:265/1/1/1/0.5/0.33/3/661/174
MSCRDRSSISIDDGNDEGPQDDTVKISVIRSSDGTQSTLSVPSDLTKTTLNNLKDLISKDPSLGPLTREQQRLFHLGKEIKSGNRSLNALGIGKFNVFSIHMHSTRPKIYELNDDEEVVDVTDVSGNATPGKEVGSERRRQKPEEKVVELLDSDSDDDVAEIVHVSENKRRRRN